jgi:hypothetical protein
LLSPHREGDRGRAEEARGLGAGREAEGRASEINDELNRARMCLGLPEDRDTCGECQACLTRRAEAAEKRAEEAERERDTLKARVAECEALLARCSPKMDPPKEG